jgi:hypothetical protein
MTDFDKFCFVGLGIVIFLTFLYATMPQSELHPQTIDTIHNDITSLNSNSHVTTNTPTHAEMETYLGDILIVIVIGFGILGCGVVYVVGTETDWRGSP